MAKIKKNYAISSDVVDLLNEVAKLLNMKQGEVIEGLVGLYSLEYYKRIVTARAEDTEAFAHLSHLSDCVRYEGYDCDFVGEEEAVDGAE